MTNNIRVVIGPPGCGKTTYLCDRAVEAARLYGVDRVLITSMTRAAAAEVASRDVGIPKSAVKTLHGHAWAAINRPEIASSKHLKEWNALHPGFHINSLGSMDEEAVSNYSAASDFGDQMLFQYDLARSRCETTILDPQVVEFSRKWEEFKSQRGLVDFADIIETAYKTTDAAPGNPAVIYADEVQDYSLAEINLLERWGESAVATVMVGDVDQTIYEWRGADPSAFLKLVSQDHMKVLSQSYRVPRLVHSYARRWISQIKDRFDAPYEPTPAIGMVKSFGSDTYDDGRRIAKLAAIESGYDNDMYGQKKPKTVMILAYCDYMLRDIIIHLKREGIPFHNPYKSSNGAWNPLGQQRTGVTAANRILAFLSPTIHRRYWTRRELARWTDLCSAEMTFSRGSKSKIERLIKEAPDDADRPYSSINEFGGYFQSERDAVDAVTAAKDQDLTWLLSRTSGKQSVLAYPQQVINRAGIAGLSETPRIIVGTIHSVKGGEADTVFVSPELSSSGYLQLRTNQSGHDAIIRAFYVAFTRAKESLYLFSSSSPRKVCFPDV